MKILFPIGSLYPSQDGGPSNTVYWMLKALNQHGIKTTAITTDLGINDHSVELDKWLRKDYGDVIYITSKWNSFPVSLIRKSISKLRQHEIVHLTSLFYPPSILIAIFAFLNNKKIIWSVRGTLEETALNISPFRKRLALLLIRSISRNVTFHTTSKLETLNTYRNIKADARVIELPNYLELPQLVEKRHQSKNLLYVGRLHPIKGLENLFYALSASALFKESETIMVLAGQGSKDYKDSLERLLNELKLEKKIFFVGKVEGWDKQKLFADSYFTILPSHSENFGNVVIESLAQGTPVIASQGTPWEILENYQAGYWIKNDSKSLSNCIETILTLKENEYNLMREKAYQLICNHFDIKNGIKNWMTLYKRLLEEKAEKQ